MNENSGEKWAALAGTLAGAISVAIIHLSTGNTPRALQCLREADENWNKALNKILSPLNPKQFDQLNSDIDAKLAEQPKCGKSS